MGKDLQPFICEMENKETQENSKWRVLKDTEKLHWAKMFHRDMISEETMRDKYEAGREWKDYFYDILNFWDNKKTELSRKWNPQ